MMVFESTVHAFAPLKGARWGPCADQTEEHCRGPVYAWHNTSHVRIYSAVLHQIDQHAYCPCAIDRAHVSQSDSDTRLKYIAWQTEQCRLRCVKQPSPLSNAAGVSSLPP